MPTGAPVRPGACPVAEALHRTTVNTGHTRVVDLALRPVDAKPADGTCFAGRGRGAVVIVCCVVAMLAAAAHNSLYDH